LESDLHEAFDDFLRTHRDRWTPGHADSVLTNQAFAWQTGNDRYAGGIDALWDPVRRLKEMDEDGIAAEVLFPDDQNNNTPPWLVGLAPIGLDHAYPHDLRVVGARAYNRWLAEFCAAAPDRLIGCSLLGSLHDVDAAVTGRRLRASPSLARRVHRTAGDVGHRGGPDDGRRGERADARRAGGTDAAAPE